MTNNNDNEKYICVRCNQEVKLGQNDIYCEGTDRPHLPFPEDVYHETKKEWEEQNKLEQEIKKAFEAKDPKIVYLMDLIHDLGTEVCEMREVDGEYQYGHKFMNCGERAIGFLETMEIMEPVDEKEYWYRNKEKKDNENGA